MFEGISRLLTECYNETGGPTGNREVVS